jgi:hypothetical protein
VYCSLTSKPDAGTMQAMEHTDLSLREQLARRGIESGTARQARWMQERLVELAKRMAQPETSVPGLEVTYLEVEFVESAPAPL